MTKAEDSERKLLRIGDVAKQTGITLRTLRYYEELDLIEADNRTKGNFRLYDPHVIQRVQLINSLKKLDFTLEEIKDILGPAHSDKPDDKEVLERTRKVLLVKKEKINAKLLEMEDMNREVDISLRLLDECTACRQKKESQCDIFCENKQIHIP